MIASKFNNM